MRNKTKIILLSFFGGLFVVVTSLFYLRGKRSIEYEKEIETNIKPEDLWKELEIAFTDSTNSKIWPKKIEKITSSGLKKGEKVEVTYYVRKKKYVYHYRIAELNKGKSFRYQVCKDHPLEGGGEVEIVSKGKGSKLIWRIEYFYESINQTVIFLNSYFLPKFFRELERNLNK